MEITRPKIFEPSIRLYDRPIHPEFFRIVASRSIRRSTYEISFSITTAGHVLQWFSNDLVLVEVLNTTIRELPGNPLICHLLEDGGEELILEDGESSRECYRNTSTIEKVPAGFFGDFEKEFVKNLEPDGLLFRFGFSGRMTLGGVSYIGVDLRNRDLKVRAVHTFPDDGVFLRAETVIRCDFMKKY